MIEADRGNAARQIRQGLPRPALKNPARDVTCSSPAVPGVTHRAEASAIEPCRKIRSLLPCLDAGLCSGAGPCSHTRKTVATLDAGRCRNERCAAAQSVDGDRNGDRGIGVGCVSKPVLAEGQAVFRCVGIGIAWGAARRPQNQSVRRSCRSSVACASQAWVPGVTSSTWPPGTSIYIDWPPASRMRVV